MDDGISVDHIGGDGAEGDGKIVEVEGAGVLGEEEAQQLHDPLVAENRRSIADSLFGEAEREGVLIG